MDKMPPVPASDKPDMENFRVLELSVQKEDIFYLRKVAAALGDPTRANATRALIRDKLPAPKQGRFKELILSIVMGKDHEATVDHGGIDSQ